MKKYYNPPKVASAPVEIPPSSPRQFLSPANYIPPAGLVEAANVAIILGQPLLLTGEPGTGKTRFAHHLAYTLGWGSPLVFEAKSTSAARDVFYTYDHINEFRDAHRPASAGETPPAPGHYLTLNALGRAILLTRDREHKDVRAFWGAGRGLAATDDPFTGPQRSVVLIDEIDKAPRDFPNDILNELELMYFKVAEHGHWRVSVDDTRRPLIVLTSNSEKQLPDPFLRRCVFFNIPFPDRAELARIVTARITELAAGQALLDDAIRFFESVRENPGLRKKPGTAELLGWVSVLRAFDIPPDARLASHEKTVAETLGALVKTPEDQNLLASRLTEWLKPAEASKT